MSSQDHDKDHARRMLMGIINKTPTTLSSSSVQGVRQWKDLHSKASKCLASHRSTSTQLLGYFRALSDYQ